jgi:hypothetical protein
MGKTNTLNVRFRCPVICIILIITMLVLSTPFNVLIANLLWSLNHANTNYSAKHKYLVLML